MHGSFVLSHCSALRAIRHARSVYNRVTWTRVGKTEQRQVLNACAPRAKDVDAAWLERWLPNDPMQGEELHVLVGDQALRRSRPHLECHVQSAPLPAGSLMRLAPGLYCCSPAYVALQCTAGKTFGESIALLMELLGTYSLPAEATYSIAWGGTWSDANERNAVEQAHYRCEPAVTPGELRAMARWARGSTRAVFREAVRLAEAGAASPAESTMYGMLGLPMRHGGFGLSTLQPGGMQLNKRVDFTEQAVRMASGMPYAVLDAYLPAAKTDIEYNGIGHEWENARMHDGQRNNGLRGMGIKVLVINRDQMRDIPALEAIAKSVYHDAGVRFRYYIEGYRVRQQELLNSLRKGVGLPPV